MEIQRLTTKEVERFRTIRLCALEDAPSAFGTTLEAASMWTHSVWLGLLAEITAFVAVEGAQDIGVIRGGPDREVEQAAWLGSLWVRPGARGRGVAGSLVDTIADWARARGAVELLLNVSDDNAAAIVFYTRRGFERTGKRGTMPPPRQHIRIHQRRLRL